MTVTAMTPGGGFGPRPLTALARAESLQFFRNKTLVVLGTVLPVGIPLAEFFVGFRGGAVKPMWVALTFEIFALEALLFLPYYSVLSLITTRRGEGVLKRLRTGEAADWQIQAAPAAPGALLMLAGTVIMAAVVYGAGAPAPVNPIAMVLALAGGFSLCALLALATSAVTKNAEAAQITSAPVLVLAVLGLGPIRGFFPGWLAHIVDWTPFAAVSDLISLGAAGKLAAASGSGAGLDFAGTFADFGRPVATLVLWTVLAIVLVRAYFRWDDRG